MPTLKVAKRNKSFLTPLKLLRSQSYCARSHDPAIDLVEFQRMLAIKLRNFDIISAKTYSSGL